MCGRGGREEALPQKHWHLKITPAVVCARRPEYLNSFSFNSFEERVIILLFGLEDPSSYEKIA